MIALLLGAVTLLVLMAALGMFSRAQIATVKAFGVWILAIGGLLVAVLLFLTGRGSAAIAMLAMLGPLVWSWMPGNKPAAPRFSNPNGTATMSRAEALEVLGLRQGAAVAEIKAAHQRLMRAAHPDAGGSDWLAARINRARDVLLG